MCLIPVSIPDSADSELGRPASVALVRVPGRPLACGGHPSVSVKSGMASRMRLLAASSPLVRSCDSAPEQLRLADDPAVFVEGDIRKVGGGQVTSELAFNAFDADHAASVGSRERGLHVVLVRR